MKGDIILVHYRTLVTYQDRAPQYTDFFRLGVVASSTKDGMALSVFHCYGDKTQDTKVIRRCIVVDGVKCVKLWSNCVYTYFVLPNGSPSTRKLRSLMTKEWSSIDVVRMEVKQCVRSTE